MDAMHVQQSCCLRFCCSDRSSQLMSVLKEPAAGVQQQCQCDTPVLQWPKADRLQVAKACSILSDTAAQLSCWPFLIATLVLQAVQHLCLKHAYTKSNKAAAETPHAAQAPTHPGTLKALLSDSKAPCIDMLHTHCAVMATAASNLPGYMTYWNIHQH